MTVRLNLLPDLRQQRLRDQRRRQSATLMAIIVCVVAGGITLVLALYNGAQKFNISSVSNKISADKSQLVGISGLTNALTSEQALASLQSLYGKRVFLTKFFDAYGQLTPSDVALNSLKLSGPNTLEVNGQADSYATVAKLVAAMQAENVTIGPNASTGNTPYFSDIQVSVESRSSGSVLSSFSLSATMAAGVTSGN